MTRWSRAGKVGLLGILATVILAMIAKAATTNWERSVANTLVSEGGARYTNHPADPGGPTKYGITIHDVRRYLRPGATAADVKRLTEEEAKAIYRKHYWDAVGGDLLPAGLDYAVFDYAVNAGVGRARPARDHCRALHRNVPDQIRCVCDRRMAFQMGLPARYNVFKRGWRNRILAVRRIALRMAGVPAAYLGGELGLIPRYGPGKVEELPQ